MRALLIPMILLAACQGTLARATEVVVYGMGEACTLTIDGAPQTCGTYAYLVTAEGPLLLVGGDPDVLAFTGSSEQDPTEVPYVFTVRIVRKKIGEDGVEYHDATGECEVMLPDGLFAGARCEVDSDLGAITLELRGDNRDASIK